MNKLLIFPFLLAISFSEADSEIISGKDELLFNQNITFQPRSITKNILDSTLHEKNAYYVYKCAAGMDAIDIFNAVKMSATCTHICFILAIGSPRLFYLSKIPFESFDFTTELNLTDTSKYIKIDTITNGPAASNPSSCFLPHVVLRSATYLEAVKYDSVDFGIFNNNDGKFILAKFDTIMDLSSDGAPEPRMHPYLKGIPFTGIFKMTALLNLKVLHICRPSQKSNVLEICLMTI